MSNHTPEPWSQSDATHAAGVILGGPSRSLHTGASVQSQIASACLQEWMEPGEREANARRIVACVNACRTRTTEQLEMDDLQGYEPWGHVEFLERQRDELLAALDGLLSDMRLRARINGDVDSDGCAVINCGNGVLYAANAAIAKAKGV